MNRLFRWGILIALVILSASSFIAIKMVFGERAEAVVPQLIGVSAVEATNRLQAVGLLARIDQVDSNHPEGIVISQSIAPGDKTDMGKIVTLKVSKGSAQIRIPDVRGKEFALAAQELDSAGFKIGAVIRVSDQLKKPGTVMAQNPASPAMVASNRMVDLLVSEGGPGRAETVQVPDLRGHDEAEAKQILEQSDLDVGRVNVIESNQAPAGSVVRTDPRAGTRVPAGRTVNIFIARPPDPNAAPAAQPETPANRRATPALDAPPAITGAQPGTTAGRPQAGEIPTWNPNQQAPQTQPVPVVSQPAAPAPPAGSKVAKVRYQVPPLARVLNLRIVMTDQSGSRVLREQPVKGGEYVTMDAPYSGGGTVTVNLGDQQVWQEKYN
ncbi:MAG: PASTA domain-containing protein [Synergistaceae bacterium]|nr:PASTA domain-containing protein [Synergistaceae bacterium]